jgi:hypothetical protein
MEAISVWVLSAFRKRLEALELRLNRNPKHRGERIRLSEMFERFSQTFSAEQRKLFLEWEEQMNFQISKEKEELYLLGISDGFQLYMSLDEFSHVAPAGECKEHEWKP